MNDSAPPALRKAGRPRKKEQPGVIEGTCQSCIKRLGRERVIAGAAGKPILCDVCADLRAKRVARNRRDANLGGAEDFGRQEAHDRDRASSPDPAPAE